MSAVMKPSKRTVSVTIDDELYVRARAHGLNLSQRLSVVIAQDLEEIERKQWKQRNREALLELNRITEQCGNFADEHRKF